MNRSSLSLILLAAALPMCASIHETDRIPVQARTASAAIETTVDSPEARIYLEQGEHPLEAQYNNTPLSNALLRQIAAETSLDFAAAYFIQRIYQKPHNKRAQLTYARSLNALRRDTPLSFSKRERSYLILFVPGLFYESKPENKGDMAGPRALLKRFGLRTGFIATREVASVQTNAQIIAAAVRKHAGENLILVSASKGGPDVAGALGQVLAPEETRHVKGWLNIGGALGGSAIADEEMNSYMRWLIGFYGELTGKDTCGAGRSLTTAASADRLRNTRIPEHVRIIHYVGVPFSGTISENVRSPYNRMKAYGPNDGLVLLNDLYLPQGQVVVAVGTDHMFADADISAKTLALAKTLMNEL